MKQAKRQRILSGNTEKPQPQIFPALVAGTDRNRIRILLDGKLFPCLLPGSFFGEGQLPAVGDRVEIEKLREGEYRLLRLLPRENALIREDRHCPGRLLTVAANAQLLTAVVPADYLLHSSGFPEIAAAAAKRAGMEAILFISKWDLAGDGARRLLREKLRLYSESFELVCMGDTHAPPAEFTEALRGKTSVLLGDRSAGKTTLAHGVFQILHPSSPACTPAGTHSAALLPGPENTFLIDTPGFREFLLPHMTAEELEAVFPEIARAAKSCFYSDCSHTHEDNCGVLDDLRKKQIARERYDAYRRLSQKTQGASRAETASTRKNEKPDYRHMPCNETFICRVCGAAVSPEGAGTRHRNHCPRCLSSLHVDIEPGDRASLCGGVMEAVSVWSRKGGEWAVIHRCTQCGALSSNRVAADDNPALLLSIAVRPLAAPPFPFSRLDTLLKP